MSAEPKPFTPKCWPLIVEVATRCVARLRRPDRPAELHQGERQRRLDVAAQAQARTHGRDR